METSVFDLFGTSSITFYILERGTVEGVVKGQAFESTGVLKLRDSMNTQDNTETPSSDATLHVRPDDPFVIECAGNLVGQGVVSSKGGTEQAYSVISQVEGFNFDTNELEFIKLSLKREDFSEWEDQDSPLS